MRQHTRHTFEKRGYYKFNSFTLTTKFPTGFFKRTREVDAEGELVVYPRTQPISDFFHLLPINDGQFQSKLKGSTGSDLYAIRQYEQSDVVRRIDWKATAKSSRLMVKDVTREDEWRINLVFDSTKVEKADFDFAAKFEKGITFAASLAKHFVSEGAELQLITPGETLPYGAGHDHLLKVMQKLAWDIVKNYPDCGLYEEGKEPVSAPEFVPGESAKSRTVTLTSKTPGAWFRYTLDGTEPTRTRGYVYCGVVSVPADATLKAIAFKSGMADSTVAEMSGGKGK